MLFKTDNLPPLLRDIPGMRELDARERKLAAVRKFRTEVFDRATATYERAVARHAQACLEADDALRDRPEMKAKPPSHEERRTEFLSFQDQAISLERQRVELIGDHAEMLTAQLADAEADLLAKASKAVQTLITLVPEFEALRVVTRAVNFAGNIPDRTGGGNITPNEIVDAVVREGRVIASDAPLVDVVRSGNMTYTKTRKRSTVKDAANGLVREIPTYEDTGSGFQPQASKVSEPVPVPEGDDGEGVIKTPGKPFRKTLTAARRRSVSDGR